MRPLMGPLFKVGAPKSDFFAVSAVGDCPFHDPFVGFHFKLVIRVILFEGCGIMRPQKDFDAETHRAWQPLSDDTLFCLVSKVK